MQNTRSGPRQEYSHGLLAAPDVGLIRWIVPTVNQLRAAPSGADDLGPHRARPIGLLPRARAALRNDSAPIPVAKALVCFSMPDLRKRLSRKVSKGNLVQHLARHDVSARQHMGGFPRILFTRVDSPVSRQQARKGVGNLT